MVSHGAQYTFLLPCLVSALGIELLQKEMGLHIDAVLCVCVWLCRPAYGSAVRGYGRDLQGYVAGPEVMVTVWPTPWKVGLIPRLSRGFEP